MNLKNNFKNLIKVISALILSTLIIFLCAFSVNYYKISSSVKVACAKYNVDKSLALSIIYVESKFNKNATSSKGAVGLMQIMPKTANFVCKKYGIGSGNLKNVDYNVTVGVAYLNYLFDKYLDVVIVLACYNAGEGNVVKWLKNGSLSVKNIPFKETYNYVKRVIRYQKVF